VPTLKIEDCRRRLLSDSQPESVQAPLRARHEDYTEPSVPPSHVSVVWMLRFAIRKAAQGQDRLPFALYVRNDNRRPKLVKLVANCGALDIDQPQPAITVMMPDED